MSVTVKKEKPVVASSSHGFGECILTFESFYYLKHKFLAIFKLLFLFVVLPAFDSIDGEMSQ